MLKFLVVHHGKPAKSFALRNAHVVGPDGVGLRANLEFSNGILSCDKRALGPAALCLQFPVGELGDLTLQTCLLPDREEPYLLSLELARHRMMLLISKLEEWALFELSPDHPAIKKTALAKQRFIEALTHSENLAQAEPLAREALMVAVDASEELALAHADLLNSGRRHDPDATARGGLGCAVWLRQDVDKLRSSIVGHFDFIRLPTPWRLLQPEEQHYDWQPLDNWVDWAARARMPLMAGPVVSFAPDVVPDWLYIWEHDYETVRDLLYEHIERLVGRYKGKITLWNLVSGIHVNTPFMFGFEQLMDLTRMAVILAKKIQPNIQIIIEIVHPFGEYFAANQRSIPPMMYAEMLLQAGIPFDGFGLKLLMGQAAERQYTRDLMQVSSLLDRFNTYDKPVYLSCVGVPSEPIPGAADEKKGPGEETVEGGSAVLDPGGFWRKPWSQTVQSRWLEAMFSVAMSKPFVESVSWVELCDHPDSELPFGGLIGSDGQPKAALRRINQLRKAASAANAGSGGPPAPGTGKPKRYVIE